MNRQATRQIGGGAGLRRVLGLLFVSALVLAGCGGDEPAAPAAEETPDEAATTTSDATSDATTGAATGEAPEEWVVGWINPLSGNVATFGELSRNAAELALEAINADGGINGAPLRIVYEDNEYNPQQSITAMQKLAGEGIEFVITAGSSIVFALDPIAQQNDMLVANHGAQSPRLLTDAPATFNFIPTSAAEVQRLAELTVNRLGITDVAVLQVDNDYGQDTGDAFVAAFEAEGGQILAREAHEVGATDMRTQLLKLEAENPAAIVVISNVSEVGHAVQQARETGFEGELLGLTYSLSPDNFEIAGENMNGMHGVAVSFRPEGNPAAEQFVADYQEQYDGEPTIYAATTFDTVNILAQAIEETGTLDTAALSEFLLELEGFPGVMGETSFNEQRTVEVPLFEWQIVDGEAVSWEE